MRNHLRLLVNIIAILIALIVIWSRPTWAQSPFSTGETSGSIVLDQGGIIQANFDKTLFRIAYEFDRRDQDAARIREKHRDQRVHYVRRYGFEIQASPSGNVASFFRSNNLTVGSRVTLSYGLGNVLSYQLSAREVEEGREPEGRLIYDWLTFQLSYGRSSTTLYDPTKSFARQFSGKTFDPYSLQASYNVEYGGCIPGVLGLAVGVEHNNNADDLDQIEVRDETVFASPDGATQRILVATRKGLRGDYQERSQMTIKTDWVFYPFLFASRDSAAAPKTAQASIAFDLFTRSTIGLGGQFVPGIGAYLTAPGAPLKVYGGVNVYRSAVDDVAVDVVAGYNF